jgi:hypothetical protein
VIQRLESLLITVELEREAAQGSVMVSLLRLERDLLGDIAKLRGEFPVKQSMSIGDWAEWSIVLDALTPDDEPYSRTSVCDSPCSRIVCVAKL